MNSINFKKLIEKTGYIILHTPSEDPSRRWNGGAYSFTIDFNLAEKLFIEKIGNGYEIIEPIEALDIIFKEEVVEA